MTDTDKTPLEQLKAIEKRQKEILLNKSLKRIKELARLVLEAKERVDHIMGILWLDAKDSKGIIDWVNSLPDVQLTDDDKKDLLEEEKEKMRSKKKEIEKEDKDAVLNWCTGGSLLSMPTSGTLGDVSYTIASSVPHAVGFTSASWLQVQG